MEVGLCIKMIKTWLDHVDHWIEKIVSFMMGLLIVTVFVQIVYRFFIVKFTGLSFPYTDEFARVILIWVCYLVIAIGLKEGSHASFDLLQKSLPAVSRKILMIVNQILIFIFAVVICIQGYKMMQLTGSFRTPTLQISVAWLYAAPTVGFLLVGLRSLVQIFATCALSTNRITSDELQTKKRGA
jgi:TRAP-type C4-dicarboxylate transport system permease small subunit